MNKQHYKTKTEPLWKTALNWAVLMGAMASIGVMLALGV